MKKKMVLLPLQPWLAFYCPSKKRSPELGHRFGILIERWKLLEATILIDVPAIAHPKGIRPIFVLLKNLDAFKCFFANSSGMLKTASASLGKTNMLFVRLEKRPSQITSMAGKLSLVI